MSDLYHYGTPRHSGRYPWGSGKNPQRNQNHYSKIKELENKGVTAPDIAKAMGYKSTTELRAKSQIMRNEILKDKMAKMWKMTDHGYSNTAMAKELGVTEGTIRNWKKTGKISETKLDKVTSRLKDEVDKKKFLDITEGVETELGTSKESLRTAVSILEEQGYTQHKVKVSQLTNPSQRTTVMVLTKDDVTYKDVMDNRDKIVSVADRPLSEEVSQLNMRTPTSVDPKRIMVRYTEDGGSKKDGVIEIRPGVKDLELPNDRIYTQCRISVNDTHYLKGMAVYNDDIPKGYDIVFNTNKSKGTPMLGPKDNSVLKPLKGDTDNPFGATVRQYAKDPKTGDWRLLDANTGKDLKPSPINVVNSDEDWEKWSKSLSAQFLSKQYPVVAKEQLKITYDRRKNEFDQINALTNPTVKKKLLADFADQCDSDAVNLKAAAFPGQATHVILPLTKIKDNEIYAPNYNNGEQVALVRYPHQGVFEIPVLTVNNNNKQGKELYGQARRAVGINSKVAEQLSGADFDGDTVTVIPIRGVKIKSRPPLEGLKDFDPKQIYKKLPGDPKTGEDDKFNTQMEMGKISNLVTDMTVKGAPTEEIVRATKHALVVIDAEKHNLDWKRSERDQGIKELKTMYQGGPTKGAATLISKAKSEYRVEGKRSEGVTVTDPKTGKKVRMYIDPKTGEKLYTVRKETWTTVDPKTGKVTEHSRSTKSTKMAEAKDAFDLVSPDKTKIEMIYAEHANRLKALGNEARKEYLSTGDIAYNREAAKKYATEVQELDDALKIAKLKKPQERRATLIADAVIREKIAQNPELKTDKAELKKKRAQAIQSARSRLGLSRYDINITDRQWEAIQKGAISKTKLEQILQRADGNRVRELATPKQQKALTSSQQSQIRMLKSRGYTQAEIAKHLGVSTSTVSKYM